MNGFKGLIKGDLSAPGVTLACYTNCFKSVTLLVHRKSVKPRTEVEEKMNQEKGGELVSAEGVWKREGCKKECGGEETRKCCEFLCYLCLSVSAHS